MSTSIFTSVMSLCPTIRTPPSTNLGRPSASFVTQRHLIWYLFASLTHSCHGTPECSIYIRCCVSCNPPLDISSAQIEHFLRTNASPARGGSLSLKFCYDTKYLGGFSSALAWVALTVYLPLEKYILYMEAVTLKTGKGSGRSLLYLSRYMSCFA
jgi:hypothetical protein